jgi:hypothetical protein
VTGRDVTTTRREAMRTMTQRGDDKTRGTTRQNDAVTMSDKMESDDATIKQTKRTWQDARGGTMQ